MAKETTATIKIAISALLVVLAWGIAFGVFKEKVEDVEEKADTNRADIKAIQQTTSDTKADIREIKVEQKYIREGIDDIKKKL